MTKRTDRAELFKGIKTLLFAILNLFLGPIFLSVAFSKPDDTFYIPLLILGGLICVLAIFLVFRGLKRITNSFFNKTNH